MLINGKNYKVADLIEKSKIDSLIDVNNKGMLLNKEQIKVLDKYNINYKNYINIKELLFDIEIILSNNSELKDLEMIADTLSERNYYENIHK